MRRPWTLLVTAMFGFLLALVGQHAAQAASGDGVITGTVTGGGQPLSSVSVNITESGGQGHYYYGYTGQDGKCTIPNVAVGTYKVQYSAPYGTSYLGEWFDDKKNSADATPVTVTNGATVTANASLATGGRVTGRITADQGGAGLSGAYVYVYDATTTSGGSTAYGYAGADGTFTTTAVPTGRYKVQIYAPYQSRYLDEWYDNKTNWNNATEITVTAGADTTVNAGLAEGSQIKGTVTAQTGGQPISSGTYVYVYNRDNSWNSVASGYVASDGKYTTHALPPGDYKVQFYTYASEYLGE